VLGADAAAATALLDDVLAADLVLFFEYDMARHRLDRGR
jgi:hypothetical protein